MVQNLLTIRFANILFSSTWNRKAISSVTIEVKDDTGVGRNFDSVGIIRDVMQNHLLQILSIIAMEKPISMKSDDIRDEKLKVLKCIESVKLDDVIIGQYSSSVHSELIEIDESVHEKSKPSLMDKDEAFILEPSNDNMCGLLSQGMATKRKLDYFDDPEVDKNSTTPTFCTAVLKINNERWDGVPFILKCGKGLDEKKTEIKILYVPVPGNIFNDQLKENELVIQLEPQEKAEIYVMSRSPSAHTLKIKQTTLSLSPNTDKNEQILHDTYDKLLLDTFNGVQMNFVRSDELIESWRIFTPILNEIENKTIKPIKYLFGTIGPKESEELIERKKIYTQIYNY